MKLRQEPRPAEQTRAEASRLRHLLPNAVVMSEQPCVLFQLTESLPAETTDAVFDDLALSSFVDDHGHAPCCHRLHGRDAEVLQPIRLHLVVFAVAGGVPEHLCSRVRGVEVCPRRIGNHARSRSSGQRLYPRMKVAIGL